MTLTLDLSHNGFFFILLLFQLYSMEAIAREENYSLVDIPKKITMLTSYSLISYQNNFFYSSFFACLN